MRLLQALQQVGQTRSGQRDSLLCDRVRIGCIGGVRCVRAEPLATSGEVLASVLHGQLAVSQYFLWRAPAVLGNITGGVLLVTLLE